MNLKLLWPITILPEFKGKNQIQQQILLANAGQKREIARH